MHMNIVSSANSVDEQVKRYKLYMDTLPSVQAFDSPYGELILVFPMIFY